MAVQRFRVPRLTGILLVSATAVGLALAGCTSGSSGSAGSQAAPAAKREGSFAGTGQVAADGSSGSSGADTATDGTSKGSSSTGTGVTPVQPRLIRTAEISIEVKDLSFGAARVRQVAQQFGGRVESETTGYSTDAAIKQAGDGTPLQAGAGQSIIVLRIPEPKLDAAIRQVAAGTQGKVLSQTSSSQDVTGNIADLSSRVATQRASVNRVRALMSQATRLQDVVLLEHELATREADLESFESRLAALSDQADLSTLTVSLRTPAAAPAAEKKDSGFMAGLRHGWHAVEVSTGVVLTVLGALLPVLVALALIASPGWILWRRRRRLGRPGPDATSGGPDQQPPAQQPPPQPVGAGPSGSAS